MLNEDDFETSSITVRPLPSLVVVAKPFGLFSNTYAFFSGKTLAPSNRTSSPNFTLYPIWVITLPFTVTFPIDIYRSASRREQIPEFEINLLRRTSDVLVPEDSFGI